MALVRHRPHHGDPSRTASFSVTDEDFYEEFGDEDGGKRKIMSVELALQRESAYKEKVARFGLEHHHNDNVVDVYSSVPGQVPPPSPSVGENRTLPSGTIVNVPPLQLQLSHTEQKLQVQPSQNISCLSPLQLQQSYLKNISHFQPSENLSHLPTRSRLEPSVPNKPLQIQPSENLSCIPPPSHLHQSVPYKPHQSQQSENISCIPPPSTHLHQSVFNKPLKLQPSENLSRQHPPPQLQQSLTKQTLQIHQSLNLSRSPPPILQQSCAKEILHLQPSESTSYLPPTQMHQTYINPTLLNQSHISCIRSSQLQKPHAKRTFQFQPISLVCKECQVPCSSVVTLKKHYRGRKHRARVEELKVRKNTIQSLDNQNIGIEPVWCDVCKIRCMNEECFQQHLRGKKHASCIQAINSAKPALREVGESSSSLRLGNFGVGSNLLNINQR